MSLYPSNTQILRVGGPARRMRREKAPVIALDPIHSVADQAAEYPTGFFLFLLVNLVLFVRPAELIPGLLGLPIYEFVIAAALLASIPVVLKQLSWQSLVENPTTFFVLALLPAIVLSCLVHGDTWTARHAGLEFLKNLAYFLLLVGHVNSLPRLKTFSFFIFVCILLMAGFVLLQYYGMIDVESLAAMKQGAGTDEFGDQTFLDRVRGLGIFNDPNDLSLMLVTATVLALHFIAESANRLVKLLWIIPLLPILYVFELTHSRGGFLSMLAAVGTLLLTRFGWRKALLIAILFSPALIPFLDARQTNIDLTDSNDTAQGRIHLWRDNIILFHQSPLFGIGVGQIEQQNGIVAHNSFLQAFTETGLFGGALFLGAFFAPIAAFSKAGKNTSMIRDSAIMIWRPYMLAIIIGYAVGLFSLTRNGEVSTCVPLGLMAAYYGLLRRHTSSLMPYLGRRLFFHVALASVACMAIFEIVTRFLVM